MDDDSENRAINISREEAATMCWALRYVALGLGEKHLKVLREREGWTESGFGERAERLLNVAHRLEEGFDLGPFD